MFSFFCYAPHYIVYAARKRERNKKSTQLKLVEKEGCFFNVHECLVLSWLVGSVSVWNNTMRNHKNLPTTQLNGSPHRGLWERGRIQDSSLVTVLWPAAPARLIECVLIIWKLCSIWWAKCCLKRNRVWLNILLAIFWNQINPTRTPFHLDTWSWLKRRAGVET